MSNIPEGCKPFNLQEALEGKPVVTGDGRKVKIAGYESEAAKIFQLVGWVDGIAKSWESNGKYYGAINQDHDLFMAPEASDTRYLHIYFDKGETMIKVFNTREEAEAHFKSILAEMPGRLDLASLNIHKIIV